jgi:hypothetical protein
MRQLVGQSVAAPVRLPRKATSSWQVRASFFELKSARAWISPVRSQARVQSSGADTLFDASVAGLQTAIPLHIVHPLAGRLSPDGETMRRSALSSLLALVILVSPLSAQSGPMTLGELTVGSPLRLEVDNGERTTHTGFFTGVAADTLRLLKGRDTMGFSLASVRRLEVSRGPNRTRGIVAGAAIGGLGLAISFGGLMVAAGEPGYASAGFSGMFVIGSLVGSVVGLTRAPTRWEVVSFQAGSSP